MELNSVPTLEIEIPNVSVEATTNYENLSNKPQINGTTLIGNKTGSALGLVDVEEGKGLSTNDYTDNEKTKVSEAYLAKHSHDNKSILDTITQVLIDTWNTVTGKYEKPASGIPKTDLASDVQTSLGKADTAIQEHQSLAAYRTSSDQDVIDATKVPTGRTVNGHALSADVTIADTDIAHGSSTVGATLTSQSEQIETLEEKTSTFYRDSQGYLCEY